MNFTLAKNDKKPKEVIVLSDAVYHSYLGEYFFGQTDMIAFGDSLNGWGALVNPANSNVNMFLNAYTISSFASIPLTAEGWLSSILPGKPKVSKNFAAGNQSIAPSPIPKIEIQNASMVSRTPTGGTYTFVRRVEPKETLTKHDFQGMYIIPPGSSFALFFLSPGKEQVQTRVAFGWWEEKVNRLNS